MRPDGLPPDEGLAVPYGETLDSVIGLDWETTLDGAVRASFEFDPKRLDEQGVHAGTFAAVAEAVASFGAHTQAPDGFIAVGANNSTSFIREPAGRVHVIGSVVSEAAPGEPSVWKVEAFDDDEICAVSLVTMALIKPREP